MSRKERITVCNKCLRASCWQGVFMCDQARDAGVVAVSRDRLAQMALEHESYWKTDDQIAAGL